MIDSSNKKVLFAAEDSRVPDEINKGKAEYERILTIERNRKSYIENKLKNLYSSLDTSSKGGELDPIIYIMEQSKAEEEQKKSRYYLQSALQNLPSGYRIGEVGYGSSKVIYVGPVYK